MKEVKAWKLTDGSIYEDYELASKIQKKIDSDNDIINFLNNKKVLNLKKIYKEMEQDPKSILPSAMIIICGLSNAAYQREDGIYVVPLTALKD